MDTALIPGRLNKLIYPKIYAPGQTEGILKVLLSQRAFLPSWIFFFIFGGFLAYNWEGLIKFSQKNKIVLGLSVLILTALAVLEYKIIGSVPSNRATNLVNIPIITLFILGISEDIMKIRFLNRFLTKVGTLSMAIYLVHPFVLYIVQTIAPQFIWKTTLFPITFMIVLALTIAVVKLIQLLPYNQYILTVPKIKESQKNHWKPQTTIKVSNTTN